jgi:hypothetical protein
MATYNQTITSAGVYGAGIAVHSHTPFTHQIIWETGTGGARAGGGAFYRPTRFPVVNQLWDSAAANSVIEVTKNACQVLAISAFHVNTVDVFLILYSRWKDEVASGTAFTYVLPIPAGSGGLMGATLVDFPVPLDFPNGLSYRISTSPTSLAYSGSPSATQLNLTWR